MNLKVYLFI